MSPLSPSRAAVLAHLSGFDGARDVVIVGDTNVETAEYLFRAGYRVSYLHESTEVRRKARGQFRRALASVTVGAPNRVQEECADGVVAVASRKLSAPDLLRILAILRHGGLAYIPTRELPPATAVVETGFSILDVLNDGEITVLGKFGKVDIVVPTFGAYDEVAACLESVRRWTSEAPYRLVLVDDAGPDERIPRLFDDVADDNDIVVTNEVNLGFVQSANRGIGTSTTNDVVLLNTDTLVTEGWLTRIQRAIYRSPRVATANPLSNSASAYSIPDIGSIVRGNLDVVGDAIARTSERLYPEIPVAVGFCLYIKRAAIDRVGPLDEVFGRGYGEEGDFCMRCVQAGLTHIIVDDAFVFHAGGVSMRAAGIVGDGEITVPANEKILQQRYPDYDKRIQAFLRGGVIDRLAASARIGVAMAVAERRRRVVFVMHSDLQDEQLAGTEYHALDLLNGLHSEYACYVVHVHPGGALVVDEHVDGLSIRYAFDVPLHEEYTLRSESWLRAYGEVLDVFGIELVHVHHLLRHTGDIVFAAQLRGIPVVMTVHDYYLLSPNLSLMHEYSADPVSPEEIDRFHQDFTGQPEFSLAKWQEAAERIVGATELLVFPSKAAKEIFVRRFSRIASGRAPVIPHANALTAGPRRRERDRHRFRILFLGNTHDAQKGAAIVREAVPVLLRAGVEVHFLGTPRDPWRSMRRRGQVRFHGRYRREQVLDLIADIDPDLVVFPAPWPETYSYTLTEALAAGIPPVCFDVGATAERIREYGGGGVIVSPTNAGALTAAILELAGDGERMAALKAEVAALELTSLEDNLDVYRNIYSDLLGAAPRRQGQSEIGVRRSAHLMVATSAELARHRVTMRALGVLTPLVDLGRRYLPRRIRAAVKTALLPSATRKRARRLRGDRTGGPLTG